VKVIVYVEGPSDAAAMETLLSDLIQEKRKLGIDIAFFEAPKGDKKTSVLTKVPLRAVDILRNEPESMVVAMPDLYPRDKAFPHQTCAELRDGIMANFERALQQKKVGDARMKDRFKVFCFKHDLEALLLACEDSLRVRLGVQYLDVSWRKPVEDQDHYEPPKRVVERLFRENGFRYRDTVDAPIILRGASYLDVAERCPQCFGPFVEFLQGLS
jgi:hypothetical protein